MQLDQLSTLLAILEQGSFSRAAAALRVTQSTVSFHIKALEDAVGSHLLDRRGGKVRPTEAGKALARYATRILALRDEALATVRADERGERGHLRIAASTIPAEYLLPEALARFRAKHPGVAITVSVSDTRGAAEAVIADDCDAAFVGGRIADKRLLATPFADDEVILVGPPGGAWGTKLAAAQLANAPLILREDGSGTQQTISRLIPSGGDGPPPVRVGSAEAQKRCALAGMGLAFVSRHAVRDELRDRRLVEIDAPGTPARRKFYAVRRRADEPTPLVRSMFSMLGI